MIPIAFISGKGAPEMSQYGDFEFILAQSIPDVRTPWTDKLKEMSLSRYIVMDNGEFEGERVKADQLIKRAQLIGAHEIIAPDILFDSEGTIKLTTEFLSSLSAEEKSRFKIMAVPQGKTINEWMNGFEAFNNNPDVDVIGLSREAVRISFRKGYDIVNPKTFTGSLMEARIRCMRHIHARTGKKLHLLGLTEPAEVKYYDYHYGNAFVRSVDTSVPYISGLKGIRYTLEGKKPINAIDRKVDFNADPITPMQRTDILHNILIFYSILRKKDVRWNNA